MRGLGVRLAVAEPVIHPAPFSRVEILFHLHIVSLGSLEVIDHRLGDGAIGQVGQIGSTERKRGGNQARQVRIERGRHSDSGSDHVRDEPATRSRSFVRAMRVHHQAIVLLLEGQAGLPAVEEDDVRIDCRKGALTILLEQDGGALFPLLLLQPGQLVPFGAQDVARIEQLEMQRADGILNLVLRDRLPDRTPVYLRGSGWKRGLAGGKVAPEAMQAMRIEKGKAEGISMPKAPTMR